MAEVTLASDVESGFYRRGLRGTVATSTTVVYAFYIDETGDDFFYVKSTDAGANWGSPVTIRTGTVDVFDVWYDKWTPGITGTKIHIAYTDSGVDDVFYRDLETATDTLGTERTVFAGASVDDTSWQTVIVSITKAQGGNLYVAFNIDGGTEQGFYRSVDAGVNWTSRGDLNESSGDTYLLFPANVSDNQDICALFADNVTGNEVSIKMYDDSANTWTETAIAAQVDSASYIQMSGAVRHSDKHVIVTFWSTIDGSGADLFCYDITADSIAAPTITAKTNVSAGAGSDDQAQCAVSINQNNDDIYVAVIGKSDGSETWEASVHVYYYKSADDGASWDAQVVVSTTLDDHRLIFADLGGTSSLFLPVWFNDDLNTLVTDSAKGVAFAPSASAAITGTITASVTETDIVNGGKTLIITLTNDTWIAAGAASFDLQRDEIIQGADSAQGEALGWNLQVRDTEVVTAVVRTSDTVVTWTLTASALYNITAQETITVTVPGTALVGGNAIVATPTFTIDPVGGTAVKDIIGGMGIIPFAR